MRKLDPQKFPQHIAFIMDGNGRWAKKRGMPRSLGHKVGYEKMKATLKHCSTRGIKVVSFWAFSTENWKRPRAELDGIFKLVRENMHKDMPLFMQWNVRVTSMGDLTKFPKDMYDKLVELQEQTKNNTGIILNVCANYGGKADIVQAVNKALGGSSSKQHKISEADIESNLYGSDLPAPDLVVRTSGEQRISNFMLWQMAYSEFLFLKPHWPSITPKLIDKSIIKYQKRNRRFGKV